MALRIDDLAPNFQAQTNRGNIDFHSWLGSSWGVIFSHPKDFTPVCTTELGYLAKLEPEFKKRDVKIIGLSVDAADNHNEWVKDIIKYQGVEPNYPIISDTKLDNLERIASSIALMFEGAIIHKSDILSYSRIAGRNIIQLSVDGNLSKFEEKLVYLTLQKELTFVRKNSIFTVTFFQSRQLEDCFFLLSDIIKRIGLSVIFMKSISPQVDMQLIDIVQGRLQLGQPHFQSLLKNIDALENSLDIEES